MEVIKQLCFHVWSSLVVCRAVEVHSAQCILPGICLLYTSDAADDMQCVDLGGRRIIKKEHCVDYIWHGYLH